MKQFIAPFKKLHPSIKEKLEDLEMVTPTPFQIKSIPVIKSGANVFCVAANEAGKTTTLILTTLNKLKFEAVGTAPRAIVLVANNEKAIEMVAAFEKYTKYSALRVYFGDEKQHVDLLKSEIFEGIDVLITTPKKLRSLLSFNGVNMTQLKIISIEDSEFLIENTAYTSMLSITESIQKCQFVMYLEKMHPTLKRFENYFMKHPKTVSI